MAKRSRKKSDIAMIVNILVIVFAVLTLCTLFIPVIKVTGALTDGVYSVKGADCFTAAFASEVPDGNASILYALKTAEDYSFVTTVYLWAYMITVFVAAAAGVFAVLNLCGMRFKLVNTILGVCLLVLALVTIIFAFIVGGDASNLLAYKNGRAAIGTYMLILTLCAGCCEVYNARK